MGSFQNRCSVKGVFVHGYFFVFQMKKFFGVGHKYHQFYAVNLILGYFICVAAALECKHQIEGHGGFKLVRAYHSISLDPKWEESFDHHQNHY